MSVRRGSISATLSMMRGNMRDAPRNTVPSIQSITRTALEYHIPGVTRANTSFKTVTAVTPMTIAIKSGIEAYLTERRYNPRRENIARANGREAGTIQRKKL
ncbi:MAG: hypothetical protein BWY66_00032 [bacterium ADurb.Bin374]|nr:MAG: hypothetical protein BWY66_00032 [bacterium ADurb.Bin374]